MNPRPLSEKATAKKPRFLPFFFGLFLLVGLGAAFFISGSLLDYFQAQSWPEIPCTIESSQVKSHASDDGTTYSVDIAYHYVFQNQTYRSDHYSFTRVSSSGYDSKDAIVKSFAPGSVKTCYVNPENPSQAVLYRGWSLELLFVIVFPGIFILIGLGGIIFSLRSATVPSNVPGMVDLGGQMAHAATPVVLKPKVSAIAKVGGALFFALFWNGIISIFIFQAVDGSQSGHPDWFLILFMVPFVLVGLGTIFAVFYFILGISNPVAKLALNPAAVPLGETLRLGWGFDGKTERIRNLSLTLEAREEATYRRGTSTYTDKNVFLHQEIINLSDPRQIVQGLAEIQIPADLVPSFASTNNRIIWTLTLHGRIPRWPDVKEEFEITILPARKPV